MRKITLAAVTLSFMCATAAVAAPLPSNALGMSQANSTDIVQVKMKKKKMMKKKMMMKDDGMSKGGAMGAQGGGGDMAGQKKM